MASKTATAKASVLMIKELRAGLTLIISQMHKIHFIQRTFQRYFWIIKHQLIKSTHLFEFNLEIKTLASAYVLKTTLLDTTEQNAASRIHTTC